MGGGLAHINFQNKIRVAHIRVPVRCLSEQKRFISIVPPSEIVYYFGTKKFACTLLRNDAGRAGDRFCWLRDVH